jgi:serine/threonine protein kinase
VVKICFKGTDDNDCAFASSEDEAEWRATMERVLNLPKHAGIAATHAVLEDSEAYYVVMERVAGLDLFEVLRIERLPFEEVRVVLRQLLSALAVLHSRGLIHKDLKLENVMLTTGDNGEARRVKLIDFDTLTPWSPVVARDVLGSDQYIAPEAYAGWYSPASDMFAVGVLAYHLLTGEYPFDSPFLTTSPGRTSWAIPRWRRFESASAQLLSPGAMTLFA